jgi:ATP-dependent Clp protease ATP-binding subunit ClpC
MRNTLLEAKKLAGDEKMPPNTGHVLIALMQGDSHAAQLLRDHEISNKKVRLQLRQLGDEPEHLWKAASRASIPQGEKKRPHGSSPLDLLINLLHLPGSHAHTILKRLGFDPGELCKEAWGRQKASPHRPLSTKRKKERISKDDGQIPLFGEPDREPSSRPVTRRRGKSAKRPRAPADRKGAPLTGRRYLTAAHASRLTHNMGTEIETKQRRKRDAECKSATERPSGDPGDPCDAPEAGSALGAPLAVEPAFEITAAAFPLLSSTGRDLVKEARLGRLDAIVGREEEMEKVADVLNRRRANSPCLIGPSGVGKTALVEGLALKLANNTASGLRNRVIVEIRPADILAGTSVRGALSERLTQLREEVAAAEGNVILFIDEVHALLASGEGKDAVQELKAAIGKGELPCIAATTTEEYARHVATDPALARCFSKVEVNEPSEPDAVEILKGVVFQYREHHGVAFNDEALEAAVKLSSRYLNDRALPDKAIALIDTAGARARRQGAKKVTRDDIARVLAEQVGVPAERLTTDNHERLLRLEKEMARRIVGHRHVLSAIGETLRRNAAGFRTERPIGSFLFLGPTGVGKTETAKALADLLFPTDGAFVRLDMSEYREAHAVARLVGAPPGYLGHEEGGQLTEAVRRRPYALVLLDEIEKAHPEVLQVLLQLLDDGRLTDGMGRTVSFKNTIVIMTSNLGSNLRQRERQVGFGAAREPEAHCSIRESVLRTVKESLPPELWNRMDELLVFEPLRRDGALKIAALMLKNIGNQLRDESSIALEVGRGLLGALADQGGYDPEFGARPMRRTIQRLVEGPVARLILEGKASKGDKIIATGTKKRVSFKVQKHRRVRSAS